MPKLKVNWSLYDHLLGTCTDLVLSKQIGCTEDNVRYRRKKLGIVPAIYPTWSEKDALLLIDGKAKCVQCEEIKPLVEFNPEKTRRNGHRRVCKKCYERKRRERCFLLKQKYIDMMGGSCQSCGYKASRSALQFHHVGNNKDFHICVIIYGKNNEKKVLTELKKCCLLCSNCHDAYHGNELSLRFIQRDGLGWTISSEVRPASKLPE